jgi:5,10-methylenetetrahydromethanopterin reductase
MEFWTGIRADPATTAGSAVQAEQGGWDGLLVPDTQSIMADTYVTLAVAAVATSTLQVGTGVTNPYTRHAVVTAAAIASVQALSDGRAVLGVGRGDSSLAHLGYAPASPAYFERFLAQVQAYLRGEPVAFEAAAEESIRPVGDLHLAGGPKESRLLWLDAAQGAGRRGRHRPEGHQDSGGQRRTAHLLAGRRSRAAQLGHRHRSDGPG